MKGYISMKIKKGISLLLAVLSVISLLHVSALAANYTTSYNSYDRPETSGDYAYWNGKRVVKSSSTTKSEIKWMQAALNYCITKKGLNASKLDVDGSFGPASKKATQAFQRKYGLSVDGSFGPGTIKKMISVLNSGSNTTSSTSKSKTLSVNMNNIKSTGYQPCSGPCGCYAVAYGRNIRDGKAHKWTEYSIGYSSKLGRYNYTVSWAKGNCTVKNGKSAQAVFKAVYDSINNGKPVVVRVTGNGSSGHYITLVGYKDVTNVNSLSAKNFLMIDPVKANFAKGITSMTSGSTGYSLASSYQYAIVN